MVNIYLLVYNYYVFKQKILQSTQVLTDCLRDREFRNSIFMDQERIVKSSLHENFLLKSAKNSSYYSTFHV